MRPPLWRLPLAVSIDLACTMLLLAGVALGPLLGAGLVRLACRVAGR